LLIKADHETRYFSPDERTRPIALHLYESVRDLPLVCPHGHVDPRLFSKPDHTFGSPTELLITPDHYILRMLYAQGVSLETMGIPRLDGGPVESDPRRIWQVFAEHFYLFRGTPSGMWLRDELRDVFGIETKLNSANAQMIYDTIAAKLKTPAFRPRALYEQFNIEVLCTTDAATDTLEHHQKIRESGWEGRILPTFRPDGVINAIHTPAWRANIDKLSAVSGISVTTYKAYIDALEQRRVFFRKMGATATDHGADYATTLVMDDGEAEDLFRRALQGDADERDANRFTAHMLTEMARMSAEDGLVMQLHPGAWRNHNRLLFERFGADKGADIPGWAAFTAGLKPLLDRFGNHPKLTLIMFTLDESTYARELAPLAGHYPILRLGPPWWFFDSLNGMRRYFDQVMETAGLYNTAGFNDDTRAFPSIPARHDLWRRVAADWIAGLVARQVIDLDDAESMIVDCAYGLAKTAYRL
jgi:glucuronate isomerase